MKYRVTVHTTEFKRGQVIELDPHKMQTQERLQKGIVVPFEDNRPNAVAEFRETKVVEPTETKPKKRRKRKPAESLEASTDDHSQND
jgi:hypothetical protein